MCTGWPGRSTFPHLCTVSVAYRSHNTAVCTGDNYGGGSGYFCVVYGALFQRASVPLSVESKRYVRKCAVYGAAVFGARIDARVSCAAYDRALEPKTAKILAAAGVVSTAVEEKGTGLVGHDKVIERGVLGRAPAAGANDVALVGNRKSARRGGHPKFLLRNERQAAVCVRAWAHYGEHRT